MSTLVLGDEAIIQVTLSSDDIDGVTLREMAQAFLALLQLLIVILEFTVRVSWLIGRIVTWPGRVFSRVFSLDRFWNRVAWLCCG